MHIYTFSNHVQNGLYIKPYSKHIHYIYEKDVKNSQIKRTQRHRKTEFVITS
jgi:hypothetical protein